MFYTSTGLHSLIPPPRASISPFMSFDFRNVTHFFSYLSHIQSTQPHHYLYHNNHHRFHRQLCTSHNYSCHRGTINVLTVEVRLFPPFCFYIFIITIYINRHHMSFFSLLLDILIDIVSQNKMSLVMVYVYL